MKKKKIYIDNKVSEALLTIMEFCKEKERCEDCPFCSTPGADLVSRDNCFITENTPLFWKIFEEKKYHIKR